MADTLASRLVLARRRAGLSLGQVARLLRDRGMDPEWVLYTDRAKIVDMLVSLRSGDADNA